MKAKNNIKQNIQIFQQIEEYCRIAESLKPDQQKQREAVQLEIKELTEQIEEYRKQLERQNQTVPTTRPISDPLGVNQAHDQHNVYFDNIETLNHLKEIQFNSKVNFDSLVNVQNGVSDYNLLMWRISYLLRHLEASYLNKDQLKNDNLEALGYYDKNAKDEKRLQLAYMAEFLMKHKGVKSEQCQYFGISAESLLLKARTDLLTAENKTAEDMPDTKIFCYESSNCASFQELRSARLSVKLITGLGVGLIAGGIGGAAIAGITTLIGITIPLFAPAATVIAATIMGAVGIYSFYKEHQYHKKAIQSRNEAPQQINGEVSNNIVKKDDLALQKLNNHRIRINNAYTKTKENTPLVINTAITTRKAANEAITKQQEIIENLKKSVDDNTKGKIEHAEQVIETQKEIIQASRETEKRTAVENKLTQTAIKLGVVFCSPKQESNNIIEIKADENENQNLHSSFSQ